MKLGEDVIRSDGRKNGKFNNLLGKTFGRLAVIEYAGVKKHRAYWMCGCSYCSYSNLISLCHKHHMRVEGELRANERI